MTWEMPKGDTSQTRILFADGRIEHWGKNNELALKCYYALPKGVRACFRGHGNQQPVYPHDFVDKG